MLKSNMACSIRTTLVKENLFLFQLIITRQIAFNKHVLKDYLATAASVGTIKTESIEIIQQALENCREFTRHSPKDKENNEK